MQPATGPIELMWFFADVGSERRTRFVILVGTGIPIRAPVAGWGIGPKCRYPGTRLRKANRHRRTPSTT